MRVAEGTTKSEQEKLYPKLKKTNVLNIKTTKNEVQFQN